jgi:hypothetical protein
MSDTESEYPTLPRNFFYTEIEYEELPEQSPTTATNSFETPNPFDKGKKKMAPGGSSSPDAFSFSRREDKTTSVNVKLNSIGKLTGQEN